MGQVNSDWGAPLPLPTHRRVAVNKYKLSNEKQLLQIPNVPLDRMPELDLDDEAPNL